MEGLLEWHGSVNCGGVRMKVAFTNGSATAWGVAPATFTTEDELTQHIMENSDLFKDGRIKVIRSVQLGPSAEVTENTVTDLDAVRKVVPKEKYREVEEVRNCSDARIWLKEHKDISVVGKSKAEIIEIANANGVSFPNLTK
jgi:hypothetical protein